MRTSKILVAGWAMMLLAVLFMPLPSSAQTTSATGFEAMMNSIIRGAPGVTNVAITDGVSATAVGSVSVSAGSGSVAVPTTVGARIGASAIARGAARVATAAIPWVGTAVAVGLAAEAIKDSGITTCPPPNFFCKPGTSENPGSASPALIQFQLSNGSGTTKWFGSPDVACSALVSLTAANKNIANGQELSWKVESVLQSSPYTCKYWHPKVFKPNGIDWWVEEHFQATPNVKYVCSFTGEEGNVPFTCKPTSSPNGTIVPATEEDVNTEIAKKLNADHDWGVKMKAEMDRIADANPGLAPPIDYTKVPVTVTAPQTAGPTTTVSTRTIPNADGSTSTETVKQQVIVTPQITSGGTVVNPQVTFPAQTVTTTTVTNNTTNVTTTTTNTTNISAPPSKPVDIPTDYNREATQKLILQQLDGSLISVPDPASQEERTKNEVQKTDKSLADKFTSIPTEFVSDKANWFSWVWTPPVGTCSVSDFTRTVHGFSMSIDICEWVSRIRDVIGWLFALYGAMNIYSNLFKRPE